MSHPPVLHREVRVAPTSSSSSSILHIDTTGGQQQRALTRAGSKRPFDEISGLDEESYARKYLATEGSVFFRSQHRSPRSFLWRVLEDRKVLELQAVDIVKDIGNGDGDSWLTYRLSFKEGILPGGVAFADPVDTDALECFVLTESKELYTITLKRSLLIRANVPAGFDANTCVKKYTSSFLSVNQPYRFTATSNLELLVSLSDGGMVRLERKAHENGAQWRETIYSEGGWRSALSLRKFNPLSRHQTVRYGDLELESSAIADMARSPDGEMVWTVCLDHMVRIWNTATGGVIERMDILNQSRESERKLSYIMGAEQGNLIQVVRLPTQSDTGDLTRMEDVNSASPYCVVLHSPKDHQFKFYEVKPTHSTIDGSNVHVEDLCVGTKLIPPIDELLNTNIWHLEQFHVQPGDDWKDTQIWIRARSGTLCRTFTLTFDLYQESPEDSDLSTTWASAWSVVDEGPLRSENLKASAGFPGELDAVSSDGVTPSEKWLAFLFFPNRFSMASLESALYIYRKGRGLPSAGKGFKAAEQPLEERLTTAITSKIMLQRSANEQPDYVRYQQDIQAQWHTFFTLLAHLHNRRHESVGFAFDQHTRLPWSVCADYVAPVRACSDLELKTANTRFLDNDAAADVDRRLHSRMYPEFGSKPGDRPYESVYLSRLLAAAKDLRSSLPSNVQEKLRVAAAAEAFVEEDETKPADRATAMFEHCGLDSEVTDEDFDALSLGVESLGGLGSLQDFHFFGILEWIDVEGNFTGHDNGAQLASFGPKVLVAGVQETLRHAEGILLDILTLIVFMAGGLEADELDPDFAADIMYTATVERLRRINLFLWLISHSRERTIEEAEVSSQVTLFEDVFEGDWQALQQGEGEQDMPALLTAWIKHWVNGIRTRGPAWEGITAHVLAFLIKREEIELAVKFLPFTVNTSAWSAYVKARLYVGMGDYAQASLAFRHAAEGCSAVKNIDSTDTAELLSPDEQTYFGEGYAAYYQHVMAVFEKLKIYSYIADFARLALQHTERVPDFAAAMARLDKKKQSHDSPVPERISLAQEEQRLLKIKEVSDEVLNRLFNALVQTGRYSEAYEALAQIEDQPMKRSNLKKLLDSCIKQDAVPSLLELPFEGDLALEADKALLAMAKRDLAAGTSSLATKTYQILYAFRTQRQDFRGAAEILYEHLERLRHTPYHHAVQDPEDETLVQVYVLLINTLACCGEDDAWLLADPIPGVHKGDRKRKLVTLADLRREYTAELDKRSDMLHGRFALVGDDEDAMDVL